MASLQPIPLQEIPGTLWIASDTHLQSQTPRTTEAFLAFVRAAPENADALVLLGDVFDAWVGDDILKAPPPWLQEIVATLAETGKKIPLWLGHGNRDFLMGEALAASLRARILPERVRVKTDYGVILFAHGDELCTDDVEYQKMRMIVRNPAWQADVLARPLQERLQMATELRMQSESDKSMKAEEIMDVNQQAVEQLMLAAGVTRLLHGHTHRPQRHVFMLNDRPAERWVLPDWDFDHAPTRGGWISIDRDGIALNDWEIADA